MKRFFAYWPYIRPHKVIFVAAILLGAIAGAASGFGAPFFMKEVFARFFESEAKTHDFWVLAGVAALLPAIFLVRGTAVYFNQYFLNRLGQEILCALRVNLFDKLQRLHMGFYDRQKSGDLISRLVSDTTNIQNTMMAVAKELFLQPFILLGGVGYLTYLSIREKETAFILLLLALAPLLIAPIRYIGAQLKYRGRQLQNALGETTEILAESIHAVQEVRAFNLQERESRKFRGKVRETVFFHMKSAKYYLISQPLMELLAVFVLSGAFLYAAMQGMELSTFLSMGGALYFSVDSLKRLVRALNDLQKTEGAFQRVELIEHTEEIIRDPESPKPLGRVAGEIRFDSVGFSYDEAPALSDVDLTVEPGTVCALVGPSGAGKSTFARLIPRFYDPTRGAVRIDGHDLRDVGIQDLRSQIALVPQLPVLFNDTVANNIRVGNAGASDEDVIAAAKAAYAHDFIERLPEGYNTEVGENALRLSGGQRQRLAVARAFLKDAPILILDEATSALDSESELQIQAALKPLMKGRTVFIIAHRFSTIQEADRILLFEDGRITGDGDAATLFEHPTFKKLYENQLLK